jgi:excisionase family DNA binding protein
MRDLQQWNHHCGDHAMTKPENDDQILTVAETAEWLRISVRHLAKLFAEGKGPPVIRLGRRIVVRRAALDQWLARAEESGHDRAA